MGQLRALLALVPRGSAGALLGAALLGGCATVPVNDCERFERIRSRTDYDTRYAYSEADTRRAAESLTRAPRKGGPVAAWYTLRTNRAEIGTCDHLYLIKDLYLHGTGAATLEEERRFYTAKGQLIATKREDVTRQLRRAGLYTASVPLPIPPNAPAGQYRVVTRLIVKTGDGAERVLAEANAAFRVVP